MWKWLRAALVALGWLDGEKAGKAAQKQADETASLKHDDQVVHAVSQAEAAAPDDRAGVVDELQQGKF